jgi:hypothetical protein
MDCIRRSGISLLAVAFKELQSASEGAWEDLKAGTEMAWDSLREAVSSAWLHFK